MYCELNVPFDLQLLESYHITLWIICTLTPIMEVTIIMPSYFYSSSDDKGSFIIAHIR